MPERDGAKPVRDRDARMLERCARPVGPKIGDLSCVDPVQSLSMLRDEVNLKERGTADAASPGLRSRSRAAQAPWSDGTGAQGPGPVRSLRNEVSFNRGVRNRFNRLHISMAGVDDLDELSSWGNSHTSGWSALHHVRPTIAATLRPLRGGSVEGVERGSSRQKSRDCRAQSRQKRAFVFGPPIGEP